MTVLVFYHKRVIFVIGICLCFFVLQIKFNAYPHEIYSLMRVQSERRKELVHDNNSKCDPRKKVAFLKPLKPLAVQFKIFCYALDETMI